MATAPENTSTSTPAESTQFETIKCNYDDDNYGMAMALCNNLSYGIKCSPIWKTVDRTQYTYFVLPETPGDFDQIIGGVQSGRIKPDPTDFERFWFRLSYWHKERRLLANYMAAYNLIGKVATGEKADQIENAMSEAIEDVARTIRSYSLERNKTTFRNVFQQVLMVLNSDDESKFYHALLHRCLAETSRRGIDFKCVPTEFTETLTRLAFGLLRFAFSGAENSFFVWISWNIAHLNPYLPSNVLGVRFDDRMGKSGRQCQEEFMRKLALASPRWSKSDRQFMLRAIETNGRSCHGTYVQEVLDKVGVERFKKLVFGKHHFCAHCKRSSYIDDDRLLACKRCDVEGIRPRAWYCDRECQRADWIKHRAVKHTPVEEKSTKVKKKQMKMKPRK